MIVFPPLSIFPIGISTRKKKSCKEFYRRKPYFSNSHFQDFYAFSENSQLVGD